MKKKVSDLSSYDLKRVLKKKGYLAFVWLSICCIFFGLTEVLFNYDKLNFFDGILYEVIFAIVVGAISIIAGLVKIFNLRSSHFEVVDKKLVMIINGKEKIYAISFFKDIAVFDVQDELFSKNKRTFLFLRSAGMLGLFKKYILIRDTAFDSKESLLKEVLAEFNLPVVNIKYWFV